MVGKRLWHFSVEGVFLSETHDHLKKEIRIVNLQSLRWADFVSKISIYNKAGVFL